MPSGNLETGRKDPRPSGARDSKSLLLEAAQSAVEARRADREAARRQGRTRRVSPLVGALTGVVLGTAVLVALRPAWLRGPSLPPETPALRAASARLALAGEVSRVQTFRRASGRLPRTLREAGSGTEDIGYRIESESTFVISLRAGDSTVSVRSTDSLRPAVARSIRALRHRREGGDSRP